FSNCLNTHISEQTNDCVALGGERVTASVSSVTVGPSTQDNFERLIVIENDNRCGSI
ncbi:hypothetical protein L9F63_012282, partial [Diploptera punctata]